MCVAREKNSDIFELDDKSKQQLMTIDLLYRTQLKVEIAMH